MKDAHEYYPCDSNSEDLIHEDPSHSSYPNPSSSNSALLPTNSNGETINPRPLPNIYGDKLLISPPIIHKEVSLNPHHADLASLDIYATEHSPSFEFTLM